MLLFHFPVKFIKRGWVMSDAKPENVPKHNVAGELIVPLFGVGFTAYYFSTILDSPWTAQVNAFLLGSVLLLVSAIFFVRKLSDVVNDKAVVSIPFSRFLPALRTAQTGFIAITVGYLLFVEMIGYTLATVLFLWMSMSLLDQGRKIITKLGLAVVMAFIGYIVFILMFETRLPKGPIEIALTGVFG
jgi:hypothetical protein